MRASEMKKGMTVTVDDTLYVISDYQHVKLGKGGAVFQTKLKRIPDGSVRDIRLRAEENIEEAFQSINDLYEIDGLKNVQMENVLFLVKEIEIELNLYASDALHLASAINHGCTIFWSDDKHHLKNKTRKYMQKFGVEIKALKDMDLNKKINI